MLCGLRRTRKRCIKLHTHTLWAYRAYQKQDNARVLYKSDIQATAYVHQLCLLDQPPVQQAYLHVYTGLLQPIHCCVIGAYHNL